MQWLRNDSRDQVPCVSAQPPRDHPSFSWSQASGLQFLEEARRIKCGGWGKMWKPAESVALPRAFPEVSSSDFYLHCWQKLSHSAPLCVRGWETNGLAATLNKAGVELLRKRERRGVWWTTYTISHKEQESFLSLGYKWEITTFLIRATRSFHTLVSPLLTLQISYSWYLLWPNLIHSFMKLSQAPAEVINYSSLICLYLRRSQYWVCLYPQSPNSLSGPLVALASYSL